MRTLQNLPHSPATQPYNQQMKPYIGSSGYGPTHHPHNMDMGAYGHPVIAMPNYGPPPFRQEHHSQAASHPAVPQMTYATGAEFKEGGNVNPFANVDAGANFFAGDSHIANDFLGRPMGAPVGGGPFVASPQSGYQYHHGAISGVHAETPCAVQGAPYQTPVYGLGPGHNPPYVSAPFIRPPAEECKESIDDLKSSVDAIREQGAGMRALRLLDETTIDQDPDSEQVDGRPRRSFAEKVLHKAKKEIARNNKAKQIRKQMILGYNKTSTTAVATTTTQAESSRKETTVQKAYDPELIGDKCQIDFDRQRGAQIKALNLLNSNLF